MAHQSITVILALACAFSGINAIPTDASNSVVISPLVSGVMTQNEFDNLPLCSDFKISTTGEDLHHASCLDPEENLINGTETYSLLARRGDDNPTTISRDNIPTRTQPVYGKWKRGNAQNFCFRDGPKPNRKDIQLLCENMPDDRIIARTKGKRAGELDGVCFCEKFHQGTAWFKLCNCDRCDRLQILHGLKTLCHSIYEECGENGFSSGYLKLGRSANGLLLQYNTDQKNKSSGIVDPDPIQSHPEILNSTCLSRNEYRYNQDYTGGAISCWRPWWVLWIFKRCHDYSEDGSRDYWAHWFFA